MNLTKIYITLIRTNAKKSTINNKRKTLTAEIFCKTDVENVIPPTKASTIEANIPSIDIYYFSTPFICFCKFSFASSILSAKILLTFSI